MNAALKPFVTVALPIMVTLVATIWIARESTPDVSVLRRCGYGRDRAVGGPIAAVTVLAVIIESPRAYPAVSTASLSFARCRVFARAYCRCCCLLP